MRALSALFSALLLLLAHAAGAQPLTVDPESIVPLPGKFDMETPAADVPPEMARFLGAWIGTWHDDRHILVVERVKRDGHADVVFAQSDSAFYGMNREWWRSEATIADGVLTLVTDFSGGIAQAVEDLESAITYGRMLPSVRPGPVLLAGQSRGGFLAMHYAGLKPAEVMGVVNFSGGWYPYGPLTTPFYASAGRSAADKVAQLWFYADNDQLYNEALIREYHQAFAAAGGRVRFELLRGVPSDGHLLRLYPDRWQLIGDEFLESLKR
jgi:dienelactone hydrolase